MSNAEDEVPEAEVAPIEDLFEVEVAPISKKN